MLPRDTDTQSQLERAIVASSNAKNRPTDTVHWEKNILSEKATKPFPKWTTASYLYITLENLKLQVDVS